jgi:SpoIIAA-like
MFQEIEGLPSGVLGLEAHGRVTHADYRDMLLPRLEAAAAQGPVDMIYAIGGDFAGFDLEAMWDDAAAGLRNWKNFRRVAVVADQTWIRAAVSIFAPFYPCEFKLFKGSELAAAREWISRPPQA